MKSETLVHSLLLCLFCGAILTAQETPGDRIADFDDYRQLGMFQVDHGTVKTKPLGGRGWHLVIEVPENKSPLQVTLSMPGAESMNVMSLQSRGRWTRRGDRLELPISRDGWAWFFLHAPVPEVRAENYQPRTLVVSRDSTRRKARFPVVDVHAHVFNKGARAEERIKVMDAVGVAIVVDSPMAWAGCTTEEGHAALEKKYPDRFLTFGTIDFKDRFEEGFAQKAIARLVADVQQLQIPGIGETHDKGSGIFGHALIPEPRGKVHVNDERVMPIWRAAARMKLPILFHIAEPIGFYSRLDEHHPFLRWHSRSLQFNLWGTGTLSRDEMMERRDSVMKRIPELVIIGAHMGSLEDDLDRLAETLDRYPNFHVEIGVRHIVLGLQPHASRRFFIQYQDRILFGQDGSQSATDYRTHFRLLESDDDLISFANRPPVYGLNLPGKVLKKVYYSNAARLMPRVKEKLLKLHPGLDFPDE